MPAPNIALWLVITVCEKKVWPEKLHVALLLSIRLANLLGRQLVRPLDEYYDEMHILPGAEKCSQLKTVVVNTDVYHNGGANDIQEVARML